MFTATQANSPALQSKYAAIRDAFGIDWMSVRWTDLQKPLYSGLAAALYIFEQVRTRTHAHMLARSSHACVYTHTSSHR